MCNSLCVRGYLFLWGGRKHNLKQTFLFFLFFFQFKNLKRLFHWQKCAAQGMKGLGNKLMVAQVFWHVQFHMLHHGLSGHTCSIQHVFYIFNQNQIILTTATNRNKKGLIKSEVRLPMKNQQNTFASTCHLHTCQTAPRRNRFPMGKLSHRHHFLHFFMDSYKKRHTTGTRKW